MELEGDPSLGGRAVDKEQRTFAGRTIAPSGMDLGNGQGLTTSSGDGDNAIPSPAGAYPTITEQMLSCLSLWTVSVIAYWTKTSKFALFPFALRASMQFIT